MSNWMAFLETEAWSQDVDIALAKSENYTALSQTAHQITSKQTSLLPREAEQLSLQAQKFSQILQKLMIRRTSDSKWFNSKILYLPKSTRQDITCHLSTTYEETCQFPTEGPTTRLVGRSYTSKIKIQRYPKPKVAAKFCFRMYFACQSRVQVTIIGTRCIGLLSPKECEAWFTHRRQKHLTLQLSNRSVGLSNLSGLLRCAVMATFQPMHSRGDNSLISSFAMTFVGEHGELSFWIMDADR